MASSHPKLILTLSLSRRDKGPRRTDGRTDGRTAEDAAPRSVIIGKEGIIKTARFRKSSGGNVGLQSRHRIEWSSAKVEWDRIAIGKLGEAAGIGKKKSGARARAIARRGMIQWRARSIAGYLSKIIILLRYGKVCTEQCFCSKIIRYMSIL